MCKLYYKLHTDAPQNYVEIVAIQLLGHAMGYDSIHLIQPEGVRHNIYISLIGQSTLPRKSTVQQMAKGLYPHEKLLPQEFSPEKFIEELSEDGWRILFSSEFTYFLKHIGKGSYLSPIVEILNELHGCPPVYIRKIRGKKGGKSEFIVRKPYLSILSTVTPEMLKQYLNAELMLGGFLARWLLVEGKPSPKPRKRLHPDAIRLHENIRYALEQIIRMAKNSPTYFEFDDEALERYNEIERRVYEEYPKEIYPFVGRYLNYVVAIADILLVSDAIGKITGMGVNLAELTSLTQLIKSSDLTNIIEKEVKYIKGVNHAKSVNPVVQVPKEYVDRAWKIIKPCLDYVKELVDYVELDKPIAKLKLFLEENAPVTHSRAMQYTHLNAHNMAKAVATLEERGEIFTIYKRVPSASGVKMRRIYCTVKNIGSPKCKSCKWKKECLECRPPKPP